MKSRSISLCLGIFLYLSLVSVAFGEEETACADCDNGENIFESTLNFLIPSGTTPKILPPAETSSIAATIHLNRNCADGLTLGTREISRITFADGRQRSVVESIVNEGRIKIKTTTTDTYYKVSVQDFSGGINSGPPNSDMSQAMCWNIQEYSIKEEIRSMPAFDPNCPLTDEGSHVRIDTRSVLTGRYFRDFGLTETSYNFSSNGEMHSGVAKEIVFANSLDGSFYNGIIFLSSVRYLDDSREVFRMDRQQFSNLCIYENTRTGESWRVECSPQNTVGRQFETFRSLRATTSVPGCDAKLEKYWP